MYPWSQGTRIRCFYHPGPGYQKNMWYHPGHQKYMGLEVQSWKLEFQSTSGWNRFNSGNLNVPRILCRRTLNFEKAGIQIEATSPTQTYTQGQVRNHNDLISLGVQSWRLEFQSTSGWNSFNSVYLLVRRISAHGHLEFWKRGDPDRKSILIQTKYFSAD